MTRNELWSKVLNGEMSIEEFEKAEKQLRVEEWKLEVLKEAEEVKEADKRGENKWVRRCADLLFAEYIANDCGVDIEELKIFVNKAYYES